MNKMIISEKTQSALVAFLEKNPQAELIHVYLLYLEKTFGISPVLFPKEKVIFQDQDSCIKKLEKKDALYHEAEIKITFAKENVNEETKRVYICPFTGKVFGDNTHPNPQDAIYDWVSNCKENVERSGGVRVKRFYVSEDPEVIMSYIPKEKPKEGITKTVYSSHLSGKLFGSKKAVIDDFTQHYLKPMTMEEVQNQNRFEIEPEFLAFLQKQLEEGRVAGFVEALSDLPPFQTPLQRWFGEAI